MVVLRLLQKKIPAAGGSARRSLLAFRNIKTDAAAAASCVLSSSSSLRSIASDSSSISGRNFPLSFSKMTTASFSSSAAAASGDSGVLTFEAALEIAQTTRTLLDANETESPYSAQLRALADDEKMSLLTKWTKMTKVFCDAKERAVSESGCYSSSGHLSGENEEDGGLLERYAHDLEELQQQEGEAAHSKELEELGRSTWVSMVGRCFNFDPETDVPEMSVEEARNWTYKINTRMVEPDVLVEVEGEASNVVCHDEEEELRQKHLVVQQVVLERCYLQGKPSLLERAGFVTDSENGDFAAGYAKLQCALYPHRNDPFVMQTTATAMARVWHAATVDSSV